MPRSKKKAATIALALLDGKTPVEACMEAGMAESTAKSHAWQVLRRPEVKKFLVEFGISVSRGDLTNLAKARLTEALLDPETSPRELVPAIRAAMEYGGEIGSRTVNVNHNIEIPPIIQKLLAEKMFEIAARQGKIIDMPKAVEVIEQ